MNKKTPTKKKNSNNKNEILKLGIIFAVCLAVLVVLIVMAVQLFGTTPASNPDKPQYVELPNIEGMNLAKAKILLDNADVQFEIVPTNSKTPNRVEKVEYVGKEENEKTFIEVGTKVKIYSNEVAKDKVVYLTFDDGPIVNYTDNTYETIYHNTGEILDILDQYGIKATFFLVGEQMVKSDRAHFVTDIYQRGHLVACHSFSHDFNTIYNSTLDFLSDVKVFENALKNILGDDIYTSLDKYIRFPGGTNNSYISKQQRMDFINLMRENGYKLYDWTLLTNDADDRYRLEGESDKDYYIRSLKEGLETNKGASPRISIGSCFPCCPCCFSAFLPGGCLLSVARKSCGSA